jgi:hypothetical protein
MRGGTPKVRDTQCKRVTVTVYGSFTTLMIESSGGLVTHIKKLLTLHVSLKKVWHSLLPEPRYIYYIWCAQCKSMTL